MGCLEKRGSHLKNGLKWVIKNRASTNLWSDFWLPFGPLRSWIQGPLTRVELNLLVADIKDQGSNWYQSILSIELPKEVRNQIQATPFSLDSNSEDVSCWAYSKDGSFSLKSAYLLAKGLNPLNPSSFAYEWIWKASTVGKSSFESHIKHTTETINTDLLHSWEITCNLEF